MFTHRWGHCGFFSQCNILTFEEKGQEMHHLAVERIRTGDIQMKRVIYAAVPVQHVTEPFFCSATKNSEKAETPLRHKFSKKTGAGS